MGRLCGCVLGCFVVVAVARDVFGAEGAEGVGGPVVAAPAGRCAGATGCEAAPLDERTLALQQYFYIDFPRALAAVQREAQLAEAEAALAARRLETYRPARSFGRYGATYTADLAAQIALAAATERAARLRDQEAELWRQRRIVAEQWAAASR